MTIDLSDALIAVGALVLGVSLYLISWPLVGVAIGATIVVVGIRRS